MPLAKLLPRIYASDEARFLDLVERNGPDACWPFVGGLVNGYGSFRLGKRKVKAHRVAWVLWSGQPEPDPALHLDHACHDPAECSGPCEHRACCNPAHLRPATPKQNVANSNARSRQLRERDECPAGHPWDEANTRWNTAPDGARSRICRACQNDRRKATIVRKGTRADLATHCPHGLRWEEAPGFRVTKRHGSKACSCTKAAARPKDRAAA